MNFGLVVVWGVFEGPSGSECERRREEFLWDSWRCGSSGDGSRRQFLIACCLEFGFCRVEKDFLLL